MLKGKKGSEMTIGTIVIIVLAIVVLVVLVLGFSTGWKDLWGRITSFFGSTNVDTIVQACGVACDTEGKNAYCFQERTVRQSDGTTISAITDTDKTKLEEAKKKVADAETVLKTADPTEEDVLKIALDKAKQELATLVKNQPKVTCKYLVDYYKNLNFPECLALDCTTTA